MALRSTACASESTFVMRVNPGDHIVGIQYRSITFSWEEVTVLVRAEPRQNAGVCSLRPGAVLHPGQGAPDELEKSAGRWLFGAKSDSMSVGVATRTEDRRATPGWRWGSSPKRKWRILRYCPAREVGARGLVAMARGWRAV